jgi:hypothetical protein
LHLSRLNYLKIEKKIFRKRDRIKILILFYKNLDFLAKQNQSSRIKRQNAQFEESCEKRRIIEDCDYFFTQKDIIYCYDRKIMFLKVTQSDLIQRSMSLKNNLVNP